MIQRQKQFFDINISEFRQLVTRLEVIAEINCILSLDIILLVLSGTSVHEIYEAGSTSYGRNEELYQFEIA